MVKSYQRTDGAHPLTENFRVREFVCKCGKCSPILIDQDLVEILQRIREHFGVSVRVNSGYRCTEHNAKVGGDPNSSHMKGMAADIRVEGVAPREVAKYAESIGVKCIGLYDTFCHIGSGDKKLFWINKNSNQTDTFGGAPTRLVTMTLPVLKQGQKNDTVSALQALLIGWDYKLERDGSFGPATAAAVKDYQEANALTPDASVGPATWATLLGV